MMRVALPWSILACALLSGAFMPGCRSCTVPSSAADAGFDRVDAGLDRADANVPEANSTAKVDGGSPVDRKVFCDAIAAESKKTESTFPKLVEKAEIDKMILDQFARIRWTFGSCAGESTWAIALERLHLTKTRGDTIYGVWSLVHALPDGHDVRLRPHHFKGVSDNFGIEATCCQFGVPSIMGVFDWDGDRDEEVVLSVESGGHETGDFSSSVLTFKDGRIVPYAPAAKLVIFEMPDLDDDGRPDLVTSGPYPETVSDEAGFTEEHLAEKLFVAHSRADGTFSFDDEVAVRAAAKWCPGVPRFVWREEDEPERFRRDGLDRYRARFRHVASLLCARIRGTSAASLAATIRRECPAPDAGPEAGAPDPTRRTYCYDKDLLLKWVARKPPLEIR